MGFLDSIFATVNGKNPRKSDRIGQGLLDYPTVRDYLRSLNNTLRENTGQNAIDRKIAMRRLDAMAGGDLQQARAANQKDLTQKMIDVGLNFNPAAVAQTVWHGSPHKFDRFDMSKIGTGEGAQAYGHGLYFAENPSVAQDYAESLGATQYYANGKPLSGDSAWAASHLIDNGGDVKQVLDWAKSSLKPTPEGRKAAASLVREARNLRGADLAEGTGHIYKADIPDDAVARFLDWDKPLSQQHPDVLSALGDNVIDYAKSYGGGDGKSAYDAIVGNVANDGGKSAQEWFKAKGIKGIRYLDGGSRGQQAGTSNFILFDDQMPRILEVNGQATGLQPWKPGEYGLLR